jgi:DNA mismatch endonuclease (patch repair protein)
MLGGQFIQARPAAWPIVQQLSDSTGYPVRGSRVPEGAMVLPVTRAQKKRAVPMMARFKSRGNQSTEARAIGALRRHQVTGWRTHAEQVPGTPDLLFRRERLVVFLDGCFWHGCPQCCRMPRTRPDYWPAKIARNQARDRKVRRALQRLGYRTMRIWEHELLGEAWVHRLERRLAVLSKAPPSRSS